MFLGDHLYGLWHCRKQASLSRQQTLTRRWAQMKRLVDHAYRHVPYYRRTFSRQGIHPEDIRGPEDLCRIPVLSRREIIAHGSAAFLAAGVDQRSCLARRSSGSTGQPLTVYCTPREDFIGRATFLSAYIENGLRPWHKLAFLFNPKSRSSIKLRGLGDALFHRYLYLSPERDWPASVARLHRFKPDVIIGYNQTLTLLSQEISRSKCPIRPALLFGYAEMLEQPAREQIRAALGVDPIDVYGATETDCIAWQCGDHRGYHLNSTNLLVEFVKEGQPVAPGTAGRVVVTPLHRWAMPLIRYDLGDIGTPAPHGCECGRSRFMMRDLQGRADDFVVLASGRRIPPVGTFGAIIEAEPEVLQYRVEQLDTRRITVELVAEGGVSSSIRRRIQAALEQLVDHEATVNVVNVDQIKQEGGRKHQRIASRVQMSV